VTIVGNYAYVTCLAGLVVVSLEDPKNLKVVSLRSAEEFLKHPHGVQVQFRYAYVWDEEGIKVLDVSDLAHPHPVAVLRMPEVHSIYLARTYALRAAGPRGLVILDITTPGHPRIDQQFDAGGCINDCNDVKLAFPFYCQREASSGARCFYTVACTQPLLVSCSCAYFDIETRFKCSANLPGKAQAHAGAANHGLRLFSFVTSTASQAMFAQRPPHANGQKLRLLCPA